MPNPMIGPTSPESDILRNGPPVPPASMKDSRPAALSMVMPKLPSKSGSKSTGDSSAHLLGTGGSPIETVMGGMMDIENKIRAIAQYRPDIAALFAPIISQARDMLAGSLADLAQGGSGMPPQDAGAPPPGMAMAAGPMPGGPGGPGGGLPPGMPPG